MPSVHVLDGPHRAVLATLNHDDGSSHVVVVDYLVEDGGLLLSTVGQAVAGSPNLRSDPRGNCTPYTTPTTRSTGYRAPPARLPL